MFLALLGAGFGVVFRRGAAVVTAYVVAAFVSFFILGFSATHAGKYTPEIMLLNPVTAVRSNAAAGFLPPAGGASRCWPPTPP